MRVVLMVYGAEGYSGLPKYFYFLAKHLALNGVDVKVLVDSEDRLSRLDEILQDVKVQYGIVGPPVTGMVSKARYSYNIARYLRDRDFDIVHSCDVLPYFYLKLKNRKPVVHQPFSSELFQVGKRDIRRLLFFVLRSCGQKADALAVVGEWQLEKILMDYHVLRDEVFTLPVGIDIDFIRGMAGQRDDVRKRMGVPDDEFVILSVNILMECKGIDYLIRAMPFMRMHHTKLIVVSSGPEEKNLHNLVAELGLQDCVMFTGNVPEKDLYDYYVASDVFVSPTFLDGSSMGIMEAEAFGLPIVSTHQEFLIDGNGFVVPEKNPEAIALAVDMVRSGDRVGMGNRSKEIVEQYDFKEIAKIAIAKYEELLR